MPYKRVIVKNDISYFESLGVTYCVRSNFREFVDSHYKKPADLANKFIKEFDTPTSDFYKYYNNEFLIPSNTFLSRLKTLHPELNLEDLLIFIKLTK